MSMKLALSHVEEEHNKIVQSLNDRISTLATENEMLRQELNAIKREPAKRKPLDDVITIDDDEPDDNPVFRYVDPVRVQSERKKLKGRECEQCEGFYTAICEAHGGDLDRETFVNAHSRHREVCTPPPGTPDGFWTLDFQGENQSDATTQSN